MAADPVPRAAAGYLAFGWSVIPMQPRGKRPLIRWTPFQTQRPTTTEVENWFGRWPDANVGVVTGAVSGLLVLDVDPAHGGDTSLARLEHEFGEIEPTLECLTGGGGRHLYFRHFGDAVPNKVGFRDGLDLRGDGGVVVAPPSIHPNGRPYRWREGRGPEALGPAPMPRWLRAIVSVPARHPGHPPSHWRSLVREGVDEGARNATIASLAGHLLWCEVDPDVVLELVLSWNRQRCRPPLPDDEVAATVTSIVGLHAGP
ncbi:MAG TPA: bifunctional DNA primase/polymerase [Burkholderiaceae bacterium]|nr:bifunctional DNA primase/polymerase [Zeimonas sp.]HQY27393.1 bifunctional DNA primase/polymerase [Burkholderiaceae bacterium]HRA78634.1 bifunctional DNA primase/polymerase [Burkholderiaceae bacterium]